MSRALLRPLRTVAQAGLLGAAALASTPAAALDALPLDRLPHVATLTLPDASRDTVPERVPVSGPWRVVATAGGVRTWEAPIPVRPRTLFFNRAVDDLAVFRTVGDAAPRKLKHGGDMGDWTDDATWAFTQRALRIRRPAADGPPGPDEYTVRYTRAIEREKSLHRSMADRSDEDFVFRSLQVDDTTRHGVFLPAPASARWDVTLPDAAVLDLDAMLLPPEAADPQERSDGATLQVVVHRGDQEEVRATVRPRLARADRLRVDLSDLAGESVGLELRTDPGGTVDYDYIFVADPIVFTPQADPPRVVLVFIDTLRADHMSLYGYERQTSPGIDAWMEQGAVFEQARSVAPWTLPSARTMVTGTIPERWGQLETLQSRFARDGWATAFLAGNVYLSSNFEMADDWGTHRVINWPNADIQVDRALDWLVQNDDRPAFLLLHFMDMHLPYTEPLSYRRTFAGPRPDVFSLDAFHRNAVVRNAKNNEAVQQYVIDRYDNNLTFVDDELMRFFDAVGDEDTVLIVSDHGEEFWEHDGFEHGHTLYDELLRVPLLWRGPGATAGRFSQPTSLLDVAPTLATAAGISTEGMTGWPLQDLVSGERADAFAERPQAFGRPLYGKRRWGVLTDGQKYTTTRGKDERFDISADPGELEQLFEPGEDTSPWRAAMATALDRPVHRALRLYPSGSGKKNELVVEVTAPDGWEVGFAAQDPTEKSMATVEIVGNTAKAVWPKGYRSTREVFLVPKGELEAVVPTLEWAITTTARSEYGPEQLEVVPFDGTGGSLGRLNGRGRSVTVTWATVPDFGADATQLEGFDAESEAALQALGYMDDPEDPPSDPHKSGH